MEDETEQRTVAAEMEQLKQEDQPSLARELAVFVLERKKFWLIPILLVLGVLGVLVSLSATGLAPFIYPLF